MIFVLCSPSHSISLSSNQPKSICFVFTLFILHFVVFTLFWLHFYQATLIFHSIFFLSSLGSGYTVLVALFCLHCSGYNVLVALFWLHCSGYFVLATLCWPHSRLMVVYLSQVIDESRLANRGVLATS